MTPLVGLVSIIVIAAGGTILADRIRFRRFWSRGCMGRSWRTSFPGASKNEIREFLELFARAFMFGRSKRLRFSPDDRVMEIYQTRYPLKSWPDSMELEIFAHAIQKRYGVDLRSFWQKEITLGEVFETAIRRAT